MPKLKTNADRKVIQIPEPPGSSATNCIETYDQYTAQRVEVQDTNENIQNLTEKFKNQIATPLKAINPKIEMGEYFVIPVAELREMLDNSGDNPEFVHICCALRDTTNSFGEIKTFPVAVLVPYKKTLINGDDVYKACENANSVYIEAYPCPPAPGCPHGSALTDRVFKANTQFNDFKSLF